VLLKNIIDQQYSINKTKRKKEKKKKEKEKEKRLDIFSLRYSADSEAEILKMPMRTFLNALKGAMSIESASPYNTRNLCVSIAFYR
jgi:hypothetical protein